ncbi:MAG: hypothetical protein ACYS6W_02270 [Planctomycetota bacterium]
MFEDHSELAKGQQQERLMLKIAQEVERLAHKDPANLDRFRQQVSVFANKCQSYFNGKPTEKQNLPYLLGPVLRDEGLGQLPVPKSKEDLLPDYYFLLTLIHDNLLPPPRCVPINNNIYKTQNEWVERCKFHYVYFGLSEGNRMEALVQTALWHVKDDLAKAVGTPNKGDKVKLAEELISAIDEVLLLLTNAEDFTGELLSNHVQDLAVKIKVLGGDCGLDTTQIPLDAQSAYDYEFHCCNGIAEDLPPLKLLVTNELRLTREKAKLLIGEKSNVQDTYEICSREELEQKILLGEEPPREEVISNSEDKRIKVTEAAGLLGDDRDTVSRRATEGKKDMREFQEIADRLIAQSKDLIAKKRKDLVIPPLPPEVKETFSKTNCNLLVFLPLRCYKIVINAHKNKLSSAQKSILVHTFKIEQHVARRLVTALTKMCVGSDSEYRLDFFREFEKWFKHLEHVFKKFLFQQSTFKSDLEFTRFDSMLESQFWEMAENLLNLLNRFSVMSCIMEEKWEYVAKAMKNIGAIPQSTLDSIAEAEVEMEELYKLEKKLGSATDILDGQIKRFKDSQKQEKASKEQPWKNNIVDYMLLSEAIATFAGSKPAVSTLSKKITPDGPIRYMRRGRRCKVHIGDFREYAQKHYLSDALAAEIVDEYMADMEARKAKEGKRR